MPSLSPLRKPTSPLAEPDGGTGIRDEQLAERTEANPVIFIWEHATPKGSAG
jgi:hypothetical protein